MYYSCRLRIPFDEAIRKMTDALQRQGFGIVTSIDLKNTFKEKLNIDFRNYKVLGACNPHFAYKAVTIESHVGLMLPCNVVVQEHENGEVEISAINPLETVGNFLTNDQLTTLATDVNNRLRAAVDDLHHDHLEERHEALPVEPTTLNCVMPMQG